ncbi:hypothetical protein T06_14101 [Trichinella sp. T6]|nr:hypothetical protein T06_14101 [Trichinella sp. T6]
MGHENLPFSKVGRSPEKFENHCSRALRVHRQCIHQWFSTRGARPSEGRGYEKLEFPSVMSVNDFKRISRTIRFDNREKRSHRREKDPLASIRDV